jgi:hypothetical protein
MFILWRMGRFITQKIGNSIVMSYVMVGTGKSDSGYWSVMQGPTKSREDWFIGLCILKLMADSFQPSLLLSSSNFKMSLIL